MFCTLVLLRTGSAAGDCALHACTTPASCQANGHISSAFIRTPAEHIFSSSQQQSSCQTRHAEVCAVQRVESALGGTFVSETLGGADQGSGSRRGDIGLAVGLTVATGVILIAVAVGVVMVWRYHKRRSAASSSSQPHLDSSMDRAAAPSSSAQLLPPGRGMQLHGSQAATRGVSAPVQPLPAAAPGAFAPPAPPAHAPQQFAAQSPRTWSLSALLRHREATAPAATHDPPYLRIQRWLQQTGGVPPAPPSGCESHAIAPADAQVQPGAAPEARRGLQAARQHRRSASALVAGQADPGFMDTLNPPRDGGER